MKKIYIKVYEGTVFKGLFIDFGFTSFVSTINGGVGELVLTLPRKFDDFGENDSIKFNNEVQVWVYDPDERNGVKIYSGYIAEYSSSVSSTENVSVRVLGYVSKLSLDILKNSSTLKISYANMDPSNIIKDIVDKYQANNSGAKVNYSGSSVSATGKAEYITIDSMTYLAAIDEVKKLANSDWYWYVDASNVLNFKQIASTPTHYFTFGRDFQFIGFEKSMIQVRNGLFFWNGLQPEDPEYISKEYKDTTSITSYGRQYEAKRDGRYKASTGSADEYGNRFINTFKNPINTLTAVINDNSLTGVGYDIESIQPGQTCKVLNLKSNNALTDNMLITKVTYNIGQAEIEIADLKQYLDRSIYQLKQDMQDAVYSNDAPPSYT